MTREELENVSKMKSALHSTKREMANDIKEEATYLKKARAKSDKRFIKRI